MKSRIGANFFLGKSRLNKNRIQPFGKPKNENAYKSCKFATKKLLDEQTEKKWIGFMRAYEKLLRQNPTMARVFMRQVEQDLPINVLNRFKQIRR